MDAGQRSEADDALKPSTLREISAHSWRYLARRTLHEFLRDDCLDLAAGLTYYAVLAVLPGLIAVISLLGVLGKGPESVATILGLARQVVPASALGILQPVVEGLIQTPRANLALVLGIIGALWFVSGYVTAFGRVMNQIYDIAEGRPIWKLQPLMILVTLVLGVLCLCAVLLLLISGPLARALGDVLGLGSTAVLVWSIVRWPVVVAITGMVITLLYYVTPNVRQPRFRWLSPGAVLATVVWLAASALFGLFVANFSNFDATYGSLAGAIVFLVWLWLTNTAVLLGAELNAEIERARELQAGVVAERHVQLPARDTRGSRKRSAQRQQDLAAGREIRQQHDQTEDPADRPE